MINNGLGVPDIDTKFSELTSELSVLKSKSLELEAEYTHNLEKTVKNAIQKQSDEYNQYLSTFSAELSLKTDKLIELKRRINEENERKLKLEQEIKAEDEKITDLLLPLIESDLRFSSNQVKSLKEYLDIKTSEMIFLQQTLNEKDFKIQELSDKLIIYEESINTTSPPPEPNNRNPEPNKPSLSPNPKPNKFKKPISLKLQTDDFFNELL